MDPILEVWRADNSTGGAYTILPDGCCDLIWTQVTGERPRWLISTLQSLPVSQVARPHTVFTGIRFRPGAQIDHAKLLDFAKDFDGRDTRLVNGVRSFVTIHDPLEDALGALTQMRPLPEIAASAGVSPRTLQRLVTNKTGRSPVFWSRLARARRTARAITSGADLSDIAYDNGFADQAHMTREISHWFGAPPMQIRTTPDVIAQLAANGYG